MKMIVSVFLLLISFFTINLFIKLVYYSDLPYIGVCSEWRIAATPGYYKLELPRYVAASTSSVYLDAVRSGGEDSSRSAVNKFEDARAELISSAIDECSKYVINKEINSYKMYFQTVADYYKREAKTR